MCDCDSPIHKIIEILEALEQKERERLIETLAVYYGYEVHDDEFEPEDPADASGEDSN